MFLDDLTCAATRLMDGYIPSELSVATIFEISWRSNSLRTSIRVSTYISNRRAIALVTSGNLVRRLRGDNPRERAVSEAWH